GRGCGIGGQCRHDVPGRLPDDRRCVPRRPGDRLRRRRSAASHAGDLLHGNNDTPFPTACNPYGNVHDIAQYLADHGYALGELWGLGYQGDQCDTILSPTNKSSYAHSTVANIPDLDRFVDAVLAYTGAKRVDIVG